MLEIIIGNLCSIGAMITDSFSGTRKNNREILLIQCLSQVFHFAGSFVLKGYSACVQNVVGIIRNILAGKENNNRYLEYLLITLPVILGFVFNNRRLLGVLPIIANLEYSIAMFVFKKDTNKLKIAFFIDMMAFVIFSFYIKNYVSVVSDGIAAITTLISVIKSKNGTNIA